MEREREREGIHNLFTQVANKRKVKSKTKFYVNRTIVVQITIINRT